MCSACSNIAQEGAFLFSFFLFSFTPRRFIPVGLFLSRSLSRTPTSSPYSHTNDGMPASRVARSTTSTHGTCVRSVVCTVVVVGGDGGNRIVVMVYSSIVAPWLQRNSCGISGGGIVVGRSAGRRALASVCTMCV